MRRIIGWLSALLAGALLVMVPMASPASADVVDASQNNSGLPTTFDESLLEGHAITGHEADLKKEANRVWSKCLDTINYARNGSGKLGVGNKFYVGTDGYCHTPQFTGWRATDEATANYYDISNIDTSKLMNDLLGYLDFVKIAGDSKTTAAENEEKAKEAAKNLAGDEAYDAAKEKTGSKVAANAAQQAARTAVSAGASVEQVEAVSNPGGAMDSMLNQIKEDSGKAITQGMGYLSKGTAFDGADVGYRETYAAAAGVGLVLLAIGSVWSLVRLRNEGLPLVDVFGQWIKALTLGLFGLLFTPAMVYVCTNLANGLTDGVLTWMGSASSTITGSLIDPFNALTTANSPLGWLGAFVVCILFFFAGIMLLLTFIVQYLSAYFGAVGLGIGWGFVATKNGRRAFKIAAATVVGVIFARPLIMFMLGAAIKLSNQNVSSADGWSTDPVGTLFRVLIGIGAILLVCFSPAGFLKFIPSVHAGSGTGRGLAVGLAGGMMGGSMAGSMFGNRMRSLAPRVRSSSQSAGRGIAGRTSGDRSGKRPGAEAEATAGAAAAAKPDTGKGLQTTAPSENKGKGKGTEGTAVARPGTSTSSQGTGSPSQGTGSSSNRTGAASQGDAPQGNSAAQDGAPSVESAAYEGSSAPRGAEEPATAETASRASSAEGVEPGSARGTSGTVTGSGGGSAPLSGGQATSESTSSASPTSSPHRRLTGRDLLGAGSAPRRVAGATVRGAGAATAGALTATAVVADGAARVGRNATYQGANLAHHTTREDEER